MENKLYVSVRESKLNLPTLILYKLYQLFARSNPIDIDEPFFVPKTIEVGAGKSKNIDILVPKDSIYYLEEVNWTYYADTEYRLSADDGVLIVDKMDFSIQPILLNPPYRCHNKIRVRITNNGTSARTYYFYVKGWRRIK